MAAGPPSQPDYAAARAVVEREDRDRALSLAFVPDEARGPIAALYAFNAETTRIRDLVSQPMPGEIRLQWWRDLIAGASGDGSESGHPVGDALVAAIARHDLPRPAFDRFLEARIFDLYDDPMPSRTAFEAYAGETASTLIVLAATVLSRDAADGIADAAGHAGVAQTVAAVLKALPLHRARGQIYVPADLLEAVGCSPEAFLGDEAAAARALRALTAFGREHDARAAALMAKVPKPLRPAFLPARLSSLTFDRAEAMGSAALGTPITVNPLRKSWRLWRMMRR